MNRPTTEQILAAISNHVQAVGKPNASVTEVALALDLHYPGMSDKEFAQLRDDLAPLISAQRREGCSSIWN